MSDGWTNKRLQADPQGYKRFKQEEREAAEKAEEARKAESDYREFERAFLKRVVDAEESEIREMYKRFKNDQALAEAQAHDQATSREMWAARSRQV